MILKSGCGFRMVSWSYGLYVTSADVVVTLQTFLLVGEAGPSLFRPRGLSSRTGWADECNVARFCARSLVAQCPVQYTRYRSQRGVPGGEEETSGNRVGREGRNRHWCRA